MSSRLPLRRLPETQCSQVPAHVASSEQKETDHLLQLAPIRPFIRKYALSPRVSGQASCYNDQFQKLRGPARGKLISFSACSRCECLCCPPAGQLKALDPSICWLSPTPALRALSPLGQKVHGMGDCAWEGSMGQARAWCCPFSPRGLACLQGRPGSAVCTVWKGQGEGTGLCDRSVVGDSQSLSLHPSCST